MSAAAVEAQLPAKPGTACLGCRRRKLKCSREPEGCANCLRADLPCVYAVPETGVKRKRGPYNKKGVPRERHLEHLVKYLEPRGLANLAPGDKRKLENTSPDVAERTAPSSRIRSSDDQGTHSENLVKDALIALTKTSFCERESTSESTSTLRGPQHTQQDGPSSAFPSARQIFEYWHLFVTRVDPITKVIHCPSVMQTVFSSIDHPSAPGSSTETLLYSIFYIAVSTCTANEARRRFGESRRELLQRYGRVIESALADTYSMPSLQSVQAVVLYMIGIRRQDDGTSVSTLFALAVRMAQMIGLHEESGAQTKPFEAEMRRRGWWHICGLESRAAEEGNARAKSIQEGRNVQFPANLNDDDLDPNATEAPQTRKGRTDMSWVLMRWEIQHLTYRIAAVRKQLGPNGEPPGEEATTARQRRILDETQTRLDAEHVQYLHKSRPLDLMALAHYECIILKVRMAVEHPGAHGQMATARADLTGEERRKVLQDSVAIISITHMLSVDRRIEKWQWFIRGYIQWHSLAIVVAELGRLRNKEFTHSAWAVLDPILTDWDRMYLSKKGEAAWDHVNALIARARQMRHQAEVGKPLAAPSAPLPGACQGRSQYAVSSAKQSEYPMERQTPVSISPPASYPATEPLFRTAITPQQAPTPHTPDSVLTQQAVPFDPSAAWAYDGGFGDFDGLDQIDFQAFDAVFGGEGWEFPSPFEDFNGTSLGFDPMLQAPVT